LRLEEKHDSNDASSDNEAVDNEAKHFLCPFNGNNDNDNDEILSNILHDMDQPLPSVNGQKDQG